MTNAIRLWHGQLSEKLDPAAYRDLLTDAEQQQARQFKSWVQQNYYLQTRGLLRTILEAACGVPGRQIVINKAAYGKPYLPDYPELAFNISHSGSYLLLALGYRCELGVDIEILKPRSHLKGLVQKCFSAEEAGYWHSLSEAEQLAEFFRFWTAKEAFVKATGRGIALGLQQCVIDPGQPTQFLRVPTEFGPAGKWHIHSLETVHEWRGALVTDQKPRQISINPLPNMKLPTL